MERQHVDATPLLGTLGGPLLHSSSVAVDNKISEARDLLAGERNYLTVLRTAFAVIVASASVLLHSGHTTTMLDWTLSGMLWLVAFALPVAALLNYGFQVKSYHDHENMFRNTSLLVAVVIFVSILGIAVCVDALIS